MLIAAVCCSISYHRGDAEITYNDQEVSMSASEDRYIHGNTHAVRLVETDTKVTFPTQQKQDKDANVHQANARWEQNENILSGIIHNQTYNNSGIIHNPKRGANAADLYSIWGRKKNSLKKNTHSPVTLKWTNVTLTDLNAYSLVNIIIMQNFEDLACLSNS